MPFKSDAQRRFMYAQHPSIAKRWAEKTGKKDLPEYVNKKAAARSRALYRRAGGK